MKTTQLRRYEIAPGAMPDFLDWWTNCMPELRASFGYSIEFAYVDEANNEFVWAVSLPVATEEEFAEVDAAYQSSDARAAVFDGVPQRIDTYHVAFVRPLINAGDSSLS